jgi:hypothetical protein
MKNKENFLEKKPKKNTEIKWSADGENITLEIENKGVFNRLAQKLLKKPEISYIHLDEMGSFIWPLIDGEADIIALGERVKEHFGDKAEPLYERLSKYIKILESYGFVKL